MRSRSIMPTAAGAFLGVTVVGLAALLLTLMVAAFS